MIGIYKFTSRTTGLSYIGQSVQLERRYQDHINEAKQDRRNSKWYQALREQGEENFDYSIIEECKAAELNQREIFWIAYYNSFHNGYNSTPGGQSKIYDAQPIYNAWDEGLSISEIAQKLNIGHSCVHYNLVGYKNYSTQESNRRGGKLAKQKVLVNGKINILTNYVYQYDLYGNFIKEWDSCKEIHRTLNYDASLIGKCIAGKRKSAYDFQWKNYYEEKIEPYLNRCGKARPVIQYDENWNEIKRYDTVTAASQATMTDASLISRVCKNGNKASGYYWKYAEEY